MDKDRTCKATKNETHVNNGWATIQRDYRWSTRDHWYGTDFEAVSEAEMAQAAVTYHRTAI
jgi:hypothetical protein